MGANANGSLAERVAFAQQAKEAEFQQTFMVTAKEAAEVNAIVSKAGSDYDFSKLPADAMEKLETLYTSINAKVGYAMPDSLGTKPIGATSDSTANSYIDSVNKQLEAAGAQLKAARLKAFAQSFA